MPSSSSIPVEVFAAFRKEASVGGSILRGVGKGLQGIGKGTWRIAKGIGGGPVGGAAVLGVGGTTAAIGAPIAAKRIQNNSQKIRQPWAQRGM
jgi:hypothetical protein